MTTHDDDGCGELDTSDNEDVIAFLRPTQNQRTGFFGQSNLASLHTLQSHFGATDAPEALGTHSSLLSSGPEPAVASESLRDGDKSLFYIGLEELFSADLKAEETLPWCAALLEQYLGIRTGKFRPMQQEVCLTVLQGSHTLAVCPTGWGKSLCYQFPILVHRLLFNNALERWQSKRNVVIEASSAHDDDNSGGCGDASPMPVSRFAIVVSPLLSLMTDQVDKINTNGALKAVILSSQTGADREENILQELASPTCAIDLVFISPEKLISHRRLRDLLAQQKQRLAMVCVDEVHCVSKWAYDFRPAFLYVARLLDDLVQARTQTPRTHADRSIQFYGTQAPAHTTYLCLTATASQTVISDLCLAFHIHTTILTSDQTRQNLSLQSVDTLAQAAVFAGKASEPASRPTTKLTPPPQRVIRDALLEAVTTLPHPMIIYVQSRADADEISSYIGSLLGCERDPNLDTTQRAVKQASVFGRYDTSNAKQATVSSKGHQSHDRGHTRLVVRCYHAALSRSQRTQTQQQFLHNKVDVLVATVAFGMGIDKSNIRSVVHAQAPGSLEGYVQEIGRAGRDGEASVCRVLYNPFDYFDIRCRLWASLLSPKELRNVIQAIAASPFTRAADGDCPLALVSCMRIATSLAIAEETVETILFLLLTLAPTGPLEGKCFYKSVRGSAPLGYKVTLAADKEASDEAARRPAQKRSRGADRAKAMVPAGSGVSSLLAQLHASDPVLDALATAGSKGIENVVDFANRVGMSMTELQYRLDDLVSSGIVTLHRRGHALLVEMGADAPLLGTETVLNQLTQWLFEVYNARLESQVEGLRALFEVIKSPSHESVRRMLDDASAARWVPPAAQLTKIEAVSIANDFVEKNQNRITSTYDAARALLGVMPKSQISHGKFAGQLPLSHSWYLRSPHFGALREFELAWVLRVLSAHDLDGNPDNRYSIASGPETCN